MNSKYKMILYIILALIVACIIGGLFHYKNKYDTLETEYKNYRTTHSRLNTDVSHMPIKETVKEEHTSTIEYVSKKTKDDADLEINTEKPKMILSYNGQKETLLKTEDEGLDKNKTSDNKVVYNQKYSTTIDVTPIVDREVANALLQEEVKKERELRHQRHVNRIQKILIGVGAYYLGRELANR